MFFSGGYDIAAAICYILYQLVFLVWPIVYIKDNALPPGSSIIVTSEQVSLSLLSPSVSLSPFLYLCSLYLPLSSFLFLPLWMTERQKYDEGFLH